MLVIYILVHLIPVKPIKDDGLHSKNRKRIMPNPLTEPPAIDPIYEAQFYCNVPSISERSMEGNYAILLLTALHIYLLNSIAVLKPC